MGAKSKIEWTDASWNPIRARNKTTGKIGWHCEKVSAGCANCYASTMNVRLGTGLEFKPGNHDQIALFLDENMLVAPLSWRKPRMIFVCSMSDIFADFVPDEWIDRMFAVMQRSRRHIFQILTKRPLRMRKYIECLYADADENNRKWFDRGFVWPLGTKIEMSRDTVAPFRNVWLGASCEDQATADARIPELLATSAAVRFISCEPMIGSVDLASWLEGHADVEWRPPLDWVIVGGESGHGARPMHPDWVCSIRDQCAAAGVPFFFKQWGAWGPVFDDTGAARSEGSGSLGASWSGGQLQIFKRGERHADVFRVGKKRAGRLLDGVLHDEMPK